MDSQGHAILVFTFSLILFFHSPSQTNASTEIVEGVCNQTIDYANCLKALGSDSRTPKASNLKDLAKVALELAVANATESKAYIDYLLDKNRTAPIKVCSYWYKLVVASFRSALTELEEDVRTANYDVKIAGDDSNYCENALVSAGVQVPSISTRNNHMKLYSSIGAEITYQLTIINY